MNKVLLDIILLTCLNNRWYQLEGLSWLANQYNNRINSILADEMVNLADFEDNI